MKVLDKEEKAIYDALMKDIEKRKLHYVTHKSCMSMKAPKEFGGW